MNTIDLNKLKENSLFKEKLNLIKEFDFNKNKDVDIYKITKGSEKKMYWLCENKHSYVSTPRHRNEGKNCPICAGRTILIGYNNLSHTNPEVIKWLCNLEDGLTHTRSSSKKIKFKCECGVIHKKVISSVTSRGLCCKACSDGVSYGEKFITNLLKINNYEFKNDNTTDFSQGKRYDFILEKYKCIIEVHGEQHFEKERDFGGKINLENQIKNDKFKRELAIANGYINYFELKIKDKNYNMLLESADECGLIDFLNLKVHDINYLITKSSKSLIFEVCEFYNNNKDVSRCKMANILKISEPSLIKYLKVGNSIGLCTYSSNNSRFVRMHNKSMTKSVEQYDLDGEFLKEYDSAKIAIKELGLNCDRGIKNCCSGRYKTSHGYIWKYKE